MSRTALSFVVRQPRLWSAPWWSLLADPKRASRRAIFPAPDQSVLGIDDLAGKAEAVAAQRLVGRVLLRQRQRARPRAFTHRNRDERGDRRGRMAAALTGRKGHVGDLDLAGP